MSTIFGQTVAQDHRAVYELRDQYVALSGYPDQQILLARQLMWEIARHVTTEEILVHPLCVKYVGQDMGGKLAEFDGVEHAAVKENLLLLLNTNATPGQLEFDNGLENILADLHRHNDSEESSDIPTLEKSMSAEEAQHIAQAFESAKGFFIPETFEKGAGSNITEKALKAALTTPSGKLGSELIEFLGMPPPPQN